MTPWSPTAGRDFLEITFQNCGATPNTMSGRVRRTRRRIRRRAPMRTRRPRRSRTRRCACRSRCRRGAKTVPDLGVDDRRRAGTRRRGAARSASRRRSPRRRRRPRRRRHRTDAPPTASRARRRCSRALRSIVVVLVFVAAALWFGAELRKSRARRRASEPAARAGGCPARPSRSGRGAGGGGRLGSWVRSPRSSAALVERDRPARSRGSAASPVPESTGLVPATGPARADPAPVDRRRNPARAAVRAGRSRCRSRLPTISTTGPRSAARRSSTARRRAARARPPVVIRPAVIRTCDRARDNLASMGVSIHPVSDLASLLSLEQVKPDAYLGAGPVLGWGRIYGGQVVAQALRAAGLTVDEHLLPAVAARVLRAGRRRTAARCSTRSSASATADRSRRVRWSRTKRAARCSISSRASTGPRRRSTSPAISAPAGVPAPETLPERADRSALRAPRRVAPRRSRAVRARLDARARAARRRPDAAGVRVRVLLRRVPARHRAERCTRSCPNWDRVFTASLDHAIWFHRPLRADDWLLYELRGRRGRRRPGPRLRPGVRPRRRARRVGGAGGAGPRPALTSAPGHFSRESGQVRGV